MATDSANAKRASKMGLDGSSGSSFTRDLSEWLPIDKDEPASLGSTMVGHSPASFYDTQCVNQHGDTVFLCEDGLLRFHDLRSASEETVSIHESESICNLLYLDESSLQTEEHLTIATEMKTGHSFAERRYRNLSFNNEGDMLLVSNESSVGIIAISAKAAPEGNLHPLAVSENPCPFHLLGHSYMSDYKTNNVKVVQASFHPLSGYHVIILLSNNVLLLVDAFSNMAQEWHLNTSSMNVIANNAIRKEEEEKQKMPHKDSRGSYGGHSPRTHSVNVPNGTGGFEALNSNHKYALKDTFIAFTMGGVYDWMTTTLFLLSREGNIFYLCPFLPNGSVLSTTLVNSLHEWCKDECNGIDALGMKGDSIKKYLQLALEDKNNTYLQDIKSQSQFGNEMNTTLNSNMDGSDTNGLLEAKGFDVDLGLDIEMNPSPIKKMGSEDELDVTSPTKSGANGQIGQEDMYPSTIKSKSYVIDVNDDILWDDYKPLLQGPLRLSEVIEDSMVGNASNRGKRVRSNAMVCDICAPSTHRGNGAPVLVISYDDGVVDFYVTSPECTERYIVPMFTAMLPHNNTSSDGTGGIGGSGNHRSPGHKGRDADHIIQSMKYSILPEMVLNEEVILRDATANYPLLDNEKDHRGHWKLTADPVYPYYFHVTHSASSQSYLIFVLWLRSTMKRINDMLRRSQQEHLEEEYDLLVNQAKETLVGSHVCPLRVPGISRATQIVPSINNLDQNNNEHLAHRHLVTKEPLSSMTIVSDALLGHYAMFRRRSGQLEMINISAYMTLYLSRDQYLKHSTDGNPTTGNGSNSTSNSHNGGKEHEIYKNNYYLKSWDDSKSIFEKRAELLISSIREGLDTCPTSMIDKVEENDADAVQAAEEKAKLQIMDHLTANVTVYLEDLALRARSKQDAVRDLFDEQINLIGASNALNNSDRSHLKGMREKLLYFQAVNQSALQSRIEKIGNRLLEQRLRLRALGDECNDVVKRQPSIQEKEFALRIEQWKNSVSEMQSMLTELSSAAKIASGEIIIQNSGKKVEKGSLLNKFGLDSPFMSRFADTRSGLPGFSMTQSLGNTMGMATANSNSSIHMTPTPSKSTNDRDDNNTMISPTTSTSRNEVPGGPDSTSSSGSKRKNVLTPLQRRRLNDKSTSASRLAERMSSTQKKLQQQSQAAGGVGVGGKTPVMSSNTSTILSPPPSMRYSNTGHNNDHRAMTPLAKSTQLSLAKGQTPVLGGAGGSNVPLLSSEEVMEADVLLNDQLGDLRVLEKILRRDL